MTLNELQHYLDVIKWKESEWRGYDLCGRYARCRYCDRYLPTPCAYAHNRLVEMQASEATDATDLDLLPEPPVKETFGTELAEEASPPVPQASAQKSGSVRLYSVSLRKKG